MTMIVTKCPLRISFLGGGTDLPEMMNVAGRGAVFSVPIDKYVYAVGLPGMCDPKDVNLDPSIDTPLTRAVIDAFCRHTTKSPLRSIRMMSDVPVLGTGLGGSAAWMQALYDCLINAYAKHNPGLIINRLSVNTAMELERSVGSKCGYQDHAIAFHRRPGLYEFHTHGNHRSYFIDKDVIGRIPLNVSLFYLGGRRDGNEILDRISKAGTAMSYSMSNMLTILDRGFTAFMLGDMTSFGHCVKESWRIKKGMDGSITNDNVDAIIDYALEKDAYGCKLLGAGGTGYIAVVSYIRTAVWEIPTKFPGVEHVPFNIHME